MNCEYLTDYKRSSKLMWVSLVLSTLEVEGP